MVPENNIQEPVGIQQPTENAPRHFTLQLWLKVLLFGVLYFACAEAGSYISSERSGFVSFWLPAGLYVAVLLLNPTREWPWLVIGASFANFLFDRLLGTPIPVTGGFICANTVQALSGAWLTRRFVAERPSLTTLKEFWGLAGFAALLSPALGAIIGASTLLISGMSHWFVPTWENWVRTNTMAVLMLSPFILVWFSKPTSESDRFKSPTRILEWILVLSGLGFTIWYVLTYKGGIFSSYKSWFVPFLVYSGLRLGRRGATSVLLLAELEMTYLTTHHLKGLSLAVIDSNEHRLLLYSLLIIAPLIALLPALVLAERDRMVTSLQESIAERKRGEHLLRETKDQIQYILDNTRDVIFQVDLRGNYTYGNAAAERLTGYPLSRLLQMHWTDVAAPEYHAVIGERFHRLVTGGAEAGPFEFEFLHRDGHRIWIEQTTGKVFDQDGRLVALQGVVRDIAERKRTERHMHQLNRVYAMLSGTNELIVREKNPQAMFKAACSIAVEAGNFRMAWIGMLDTAGQTMTPVASAGWVEGYLDTLIVDLQNPVHRAGPTLQAFLTGKHQVCNDMRTDPRVEPWREAALERGYKACASLAIKVAGKAVGVFVLHAPEPDFFQEDEVRLLDELAVDIGFGLEVHQQETGRLRVEESLQASERQFSNAFENAAIGMALIAPDGRWLKVNRAICKMVGYTAVELCQLKFQDITHPDDLEDDLDHVRELLSGEADSYQMEKRYLHREGRTVWIHLSVSLVRDGQGQPVHFISQIQDITDRRHIADQLRQAQKMEAIGQLAGGVAHDFNNIVGAIMLQAEVSAMDPSIPKNVREDLEAIRATAERAANLTRQLLLFSRKQVMQLRNLDLNDVVANLTTMLRRVIGEDIQLQLHLHPSPLITHADAGMMDQILLNLTVNARDAMPHGGTLLVETAGRTLDETVTFIDPDAGPGRYVTMSVSDTGTGIPEEVMPHIFEPFFTTKEPGKGTGLGLATVFGIVKQHRGFIEVESPLGRGTKFTIFLPASEVETESEAEPEKPKPQGGTETILLVEDEPPVRLLIHAILEKNGYEVLECVNGVEALRSWSERREDVSLLLTDLVIPAGVSGQDLARQFRDEKPALHVIFMSGYSSEVAGRNLALKVGENFLQKPFSQEELLETVRRSLDS